MTSKYRDLKSLGSNAVPVQVRPCQELGQATRSSLWPPSQREVPCNGKRVSAAGAIALQAGTEDLGAAVSRGFICFRNAAAFKNYVLESVLGQSALEVEEVEPTE